MDVGRMIDHIQNVNTRQFDNFSKGKTSIKLFHPPGGEDHIQLGWNFNDNEEKKLKPKQNYHKNDYIQQKEYYKGYHINRYVDDSSLTLKFQKAEMKDNNKENDSSKKSFSKEDKKINQKNENVYEEKEKDKNSVKNEDKEIEKNIKDKDKIEDITKGGKILVFDFCK